LGKEGIRNTGCNGSSSEVLAVGGLKGMCGHRIAVQKEAGHTPGVLKSAEQEGRTEVGSPSDMRLRRTGSEGPNTAKDFTVGE